MRETSNMEASIGGRQSLMEKKKKLRAEGGKRKIYKNRLVMPGGCPGPQWDKSARPPRG